jgi:hypothetical protein
MDERAPVFEGGVRIMDSTKGRTGNGNRELRRRFAGLEARSE